MLAFYAKQAMGHVVGPKRRAEEVERLGLALVRSMARNGRDGTTAGCSREGRLQRILFLDLNGRRGVLGALPSPWLG